MSVISKRHPREPRDDVVWAAQNRDSGVTLVYVATARAARIPRVPGQLGTHHQTGLGSPKATGEKRWP